MNHRGVALAVLFLLASGAWGAPDEAALGKDQGYPVGTVRNWTQPAYRVGSWSAPQRIEGLANRAVPRSSSPTAVPSAPSTAPIRYLHNGAERSLDDYLDRQRVTSLQVIKDGQVIVERYQYGRGPEARFLSYSMAKSVTALLVGVALDKGVIRSLDDKAQAYSPTLAGSAYGAVSIRNLLRMASGIDFTENYTPSDDLAKLSRSAFTDSPPLTELFKAFASRHPEGSRFNYASLETLALGYLLKDATGKSIAELTHEWLWEPMGAQDEAYWLLSKSGMEGAYCCLAASPRDWAKLALLLLGNGALGSRRVVSEAYLREATSADQLPPALRGSASPMFAGYGYQFWLLPGAGRSFMMRGTHGQALFVDVDAGLAMVQTAVYTQPSERLDPGPHAEMLDLWRGVVKSLASR